MVDRTMQYGRCISLCLVLDPGVGRVVGFPSVRCPESRWLVEHCGLWLWLVVGAYVWSAGNVQCVGTVVGQFVGVCLCSVCDFQAIRRVTIQGGEVLLLSCYCYYCCPIEVKANLTL